MKEALSKIETYVTVTFRHPSINETKERKTLSDSQRVDLSPNLRIARGALKSWFDFGIPKAFHQISRHSSFPEVGLRNLLNNRFSLFKK